MDFLCHLPELQLDNKADEHMIVLFLVLAVLFFFLWGDRKATLCPGRVTYFMFSASVHYFAEEVEERL